MSLQEEIDKSRSEIKTDSYSMSIGEWISMYQDGEVNIHPEFQRFFRWSSEQKAKFIESILLGLPIPPIFVSQTEEGIWEVIDGIQRLSTIYEFVGILKDESGELKPPLVIEKSLSPSNNFSFANITPYLPALAGKKWEDNERNSLTPSQRLYIKRSKIGVHIVLRESDIKAKFELFQRLNTGGSALSDQEVRNCIIVMLEPSFYQWLQILSENEDFQESVPITEVALSQRYDLELILRFIVFRKLAEEHLKKIGGNVGNYMTDAIVNILYKDPESKDKRSIDLEKEGKVFKATFKLLSESTGSDTFRRFNVTKKRHQGPFIIPAFEVIALGIGYYDGQPPLSTENLRKTIEDLWENEEFKRYSRSGASASYRLPKLIPLGRRIFGNED